MLEKIRLPPKPSLRRNNWVVDASNCQGCSSQFTFINRKHHCRRCGGIFCNSCTQQRMVLRGQGDSPVRICEPCEKLEEAARFELRQGRRDGRGTSKSTLRCDEVLNQILGHDGEQYFSSGNHSTNSTISHSQRSIGGASSSSTMGHANDESLFSTPYDSSVHLNKNLRDPMAQSKYAQIIGSLLHLINCTKPDIYTLCRLSRCTHYPNNKY